MPGKHSDCTRAYACARAERTVPPRPTPHNTRPPLVTTWPPALAVPLVLPVCSVRLPTAVALVVLGRQRDGGEAMPA